jgi:hypothetical protein
VWEEIDFLRTALEFDDCVRKCAAAAVEGEMKRKNLSIRTMETKAGEK